MVKFGGALSALAGTALMAPIRRPGLILISQTERNGQTPSFIKSPNTAVGHESRIQMHGQSELVAHPMYAAVLGRPLYQGDLASRVLHFVRESQVTHHVLQVPDIRVFLVPPFLL